MKLNFKLIKRLTSPMCILNPILVYTFGVLLILVPKLFKTFVFCLELLKRNNTLVIVVRIS